MNSRIGDMMGDISSAQKAPDFLGRTQSGGLFGGSANPSNYYQDESPSRGLFGKLRSGGFGEPEAPNQDYTVTTKDPLDPEPTVDMNFSGGKAVFDKLGIDEEKLFGKSDEPVMYPAIPDNGDPNSPVNKDRPLFGPIPGNQSDRPPQQQMPFFGMQNPMSNMFGMGQMMNPFGGAGFGGMGNGMNPFMGMMSMMFQPMMQMMQMFNPFMNPFGMGGGGYGPGFGGALPQLFPMPQQQMPFFGSRIPYGTGEQPITESPMDRLRDILGRDVLGRDRVPRVGDIVARKPNYGAFLNPDGSVYEGPRTMDFQDRDGDGIDDRYQRGPSGNYVTNRGGGSYIDMTTGIEYADGTGPRHRGGMGFNPLVDRINEQMSRLKPYTLTDEDNATIRDMSDPQGEAEAKAFVARQLAGPQRGIIGNALTRLFG